MGSLFGKIFFSFWLAAVLLAGAMIGVTRLMGAGTIDEAQRDLAGLAPTVASLWTEGGGVAAVIWLRGLPLEKRPVLLDARGRPAAPRQHLPRHLMRWLPHSLEPGVQNLSPGHVAVVEPLPNTDPPLYLALVLRPGQLPLMPLWLRILLALLVIALVSYGLAALLTRRLYRLRLAAQALAAGDLSVRVGRRGGDEVEALARDFDLMAGRVRELLETQKRLLRDVSHELRSPLARLRVALELAERGGDPSKAVARIGKEADELERLITQVLSLARLESGQAALERRPVPLRELLSRVVTDADFEAQSKGKGVACISAFEVTLAGDPVSLRSAVENVIRNAVRHTPEGSHVEASLREEGSEALIEVRDRGPGVPEDQLEAIFSPFARSSEARERSGGGYGLGLAIASRAVAAHGGRIQARNHPEGGLLVTIRLPLRGTIE
ncbi:MAG: hypothetical protein A2286_05920 [Gammaproteobacteria bacterium RIFOXYA12_FULL_61_12]|nr:MAG: hypothetical protein A2514_04385 [Gammaproteobacteria bacterium RIFOXYD12_FULL_61_37]OGT94543.1 MAG: hypothetical protein A2286_05920 [Gammaproteobacteria bacterium RIFOXYA12_FULL_61_12]